MAKCIYIYAALVGVRQQTTHSSVFEWRACFPNNSSFAYYFPLNWLCNELNVSAEVSMSQWADSCLYLCICWQMHKSTIVIVNAIVAICVFAVVVVVVVVGGVVTTINPLINLHLIFLYLFVSSDKWCTAFYKMKIKSWTIGYGLLKTSCCNLSANNRLIATASVWRAWN